MDPGLCGVIISNFQSFPSGITCSERFNILLWTLQHFIIAKRCFSLIVSEEAPCLRFLYAGSRLGSTDCQIFDVESRLGNGLSQKSFKSSNFPPPDHNWELNFIVTQPTSPPASHISEIFSTDLSEIFLLLTILCSRRKKSSEWRCWLPWRGFSSKFWTICQTRESLRVLIPTEWTVTNSIIAQLVCNYKKRNTCWLLTVEVHHWLILDWGEFKYSAICEIFTNYYY